MLLCFGSRWGSVRGTRRLSVDQALPEAIEIHTPEDPITSLTCLIRIDLQ